MQSFNGVCKYNQTQDTDICVRDNSTHLEGEYHFFPGREGVDKQHLYSVVPPTVLGRLKLPPAVHHRQEYGETCYSGHLKIWTIVQTGCLAVVPNSYTHMNDILGQPWKIRTLLVVPKVSA